MEILVIGGTRNVGHALVLELLAAGHRVSIFNRGLTPNELPAAVTRLHGDRTQPGQLSSALAGRHFDAAVDMSLYNGADAAKAVELLADRIGHYIFVSSGQVYLVRQGLEQRPFREEDYDGPVMPKPITSAYDERNWDYGIGKREAEDVMERAWRERGFPFTSLRLPAVNSERDYLYRVYSYWIRIRDGGPIIVPDPPGYRVRPVDGRDVVRAIQLLLEGGLGKGQAYNLAQDEVVSLDDFLVMMGLIMAREVRVARVARAMLEAHGLLPDCSPFSERWLSELDNRRGKRELGFSYAPMETCIRRLVGYFDSHAVTPPRGYRRRRLELDLAKQS